MTRSIITGIGALLFLFSLALFTIWLVWIPAAREPPYRLVASWGGEGTAPGQFRDPNGIAVYGNEVFVADSRNHRIQVFDSVGHFRRQIGHAGNGSGSLGRPMNITVADNKLYVADYWNDDIRIFSLDGEPLGIVGGSGAGPGRLNSPGGVAIRPAGDILVADFYNQRVQELKPDGTFVRQWGRTGKKGYVSPGVFNYPIDVAVNGKGWIYVADGYNDRIQVFGANGRFLFKWGGPFAMNIRGTFNGWFKTPTSIAIGPGEDVFVADEENNRIQKFSADGVFLTKFGVKPRRKGYTESAVVVARDGTVYTTNLIDNRVEVWKAIR